MSNPENIKSYESAVDSRDIAWKQYQEYEEAIQREVEEKGFASPNTLRASLSAYLELLPFLPGAEPPKPSRNLREILSGIFRRGNTEVMHNQEATLDPVYSTESPDT
ncbi:hypothetical protein HY468_01775 [Candidatus Roizmanbacteria bacterium]|nr:hypothetical protein [Candidatus Roizmanbacteria bacterium]